MSTLIGCAGVVLATWLVVFAPKSLENASKTRKYTGGSMF
jgi:hypothetical protein